MRCGVSRTRGVSAIRTARARGARAPRRGANASEAITEYCSASVLGCSVAVCIARGGSQHQVDEQLRLAPDALPRPALLLKLECAWSGQRPQPAGADQRLVDATESP